MELRVFDITYLYRDEDSLGERAAGIERLVRAEQPDALARPRDRLGEGVLLVLRQVAQTRHDLGVGVEHLAVIHL